MVMFDANRRAIRTSFTSTQDFHRKALVSPLNEKGVPNALQGIRIVLFLKCPAGFEVSSFWMLIL